MILPLSELFNQGANVSRTLRLPVRFPSLCFRFHLLTPWVATPLEDPDLDKCKQTPTIWYSLIDLAISKQQTQRHGNADAGKICCCCHHFLVWCRHVAQWFLLLFQTSCRDPAPWIQSDFPHIQMLFYSAVIVGAPKRNVSWTQAIGQCWWTAVGRRSVCRSVATSWKHM